MAENKFISQITVNGENYDVKDTTARTNAATAQSTAETAQSTANTAKTNAATAQTTANSKIASVSNADKSLTFTTDTSKSVTGKVNISTTTGNTLQLNADGLFVPTPSSYTLPAATSSALGGIQIGYTQSGKNYPVQLSSNKAYVNVPWTDTTYTLPIAASGTRGGIQVGYTTSGKNYAVQLSNEKAYVNVPWTDTDTHYASSTIVGASSTATANATATNGNVYVNHIENGAVKSYHNIKGTGATTVTSDSSGVITINSVNTTYTSLKNPYSLTLSKTNSSGTSSSITYDGSAAKSFTTGNTASVQGTATVATSAWSSITAVNDYAYRASVSVTGMTASHVPEVMFSLSDATSGNFAPVSVSYAGGVYIYAKEIPSATVSVTVVGRIVV